jgi:hypothetical protein
MGEAWATLAEKAPVALLAHAALARALPAAAVEALFLEHRGASYTYKLTMSTVVDLLLQVIAGRERSAYAAFRAAPGAEGVSAQAFYGKLGRVPPASACALVAASAHRLRAAVEGRVPPRPDGPLAGYRVRVLDGTQPDGGEHRLGVLRCLGPCGLPCRLVVRYDPATGLCDAAAAGEDAYEAEPAIALQLLGRADPDDLYVADRGYSLGHVFGTLIARRASFLMREHRGQLRADAVGPPEPRGRCPTGELHEHLVDAHDAHREAVYRVRRVVVRLDTPTERGDSEVVLLTDLPPAVPAAALAELYRERWRIERQFAFLKGVLRGELPSLGEPRAAILVLCLAMVASNAVAAVQAALASTHPDEDPRGLSGYDLAEEIAETRRAVELFIPERVWHGIAAEPEADFVGRCQGLARGVAWDRYRVHRRAPKKPPPRRTSGRERHHFSTYRLQQDARMR